MFSNRTGLIETWTRPVLTSSQHLEIPSPSKDEHQHSQTGQNLSEKGTQDSRTACLLKFLIIILKLPSHFERKEPWKAYLESGFQSFAEFYWEYQSFTTSKCIPAIGRTV
ncbi:hypothetical protein PoB_004592000 [Plakobranchus ocellatus]|uniref:Uncharacterized protein n=1 Tax=Plakobranchus ocellatus TaxID=259542 RepID=A0AAV4BIT9_9GAST|nr:hypothetical protein PoB_004592000 [Plakobranchus ocellatus]